MVESLWNGAETAALTCGRVPAGAALPPPGQRSARDYFELLCRDNQLSAAVVFLSHALSRREAAWWAALCLWSLERAQPSPTADAALRAVLRWVRQPTEAHCRQALEVVGEEPAGLLAQAVSFCGASMTAPGLPVVAPPPYLANQVIAGVLRLAAAKGGDDRLREFLQWGAEVADGKNRWNEEQP